MVLCDGPRETRLAHLERVPLVHKGLVDFQVENVLAGAAAAWCLGVPLELVRLGLESFSCGTTGSPGRFNLLDLEGGSIVVDYGHNVPSLEQICATVRKLPHERRTAVYSAAGDRRDEDLLAQGRLLGATFDRVVIYEDAYIRGRQPGEITRLISQGIAEAVARGAACAIESGGNWEQSAALVRRCPGLKTATAPASATRSSTSSPASWPTTRRTAHRRNTSPSSCETADWAAPSVPRG
ncbi:MAG: hypothetical protein EBX51_00940 [Acidimicrobiia bacterium]|nr:hypothetical protein [Acidimicrobiia bacterium]